MNSFYDDFVTESEFLGKAPASYLDNLFLASLTSPVQRENYDYAQYSSLFSTAANEEMPDLEPDHPGLDIYDDPSEAMFKDVVNASSLEPTSSPSTSTTPASEAVECLVTSGNEVVFTPATRPTAQRSTGFRRETQLISVDAPVQKKSAVPTKRKRTAAEIADERAERKKLQNTLSARKSRARKQEYLKELEENLDKVSMENEVHKKRIQELEAFIRNLGLSC